MSDQDAFANLAPGAEITVRALKYDRAEYRRWTANLMGRTPGGIVLEATFGPVVEGRSPFFAGDRAVEYFYTDRGYNVIAGYAPDGALRAYYCNISEPARLTIADTGPEISFVDLDIDVLVTPAGEYAVTDEDEFARNAERYGYPPGVREGARTALAALLTAVRERQAPFDTLAAAPGRRW